MAESEQKFSLGERLREARTAQHLSIRELSRRSGVTKDTISAIERGQRRAQLSTLEKLAGGLGLEVSDLTGWDPKDLGAQLDKQLNDVTGWLRARGYGLTAMTKQEFAALLDSSSADELEVLKPRMLNELDALAREYALAGESDFRPKWAYARAGGRRIWLEFHAAHSERAALENAPAEVVA